MSLKTSISSITSSDPMSKPARLQVDINSIEENDKPPPQQIGSSTFNIWFLKYSGGDSSVINSFVKSKFRLNVEKDQGYTRARNNSPICLFFSRGCCYMGSNCKYFHCLPNKVKVSNTNQAVDCFGRNKTSDYNDDMDGVGSFNRINKTLYIGGLIMKPNIEELMSKNFEEFGDIEKIKVIYNKNIAFITMKTESEAQFAKEAMDRQCLINYGNKSSSSSSTTSTNNNTNTNNNPSTLTSLRHSNSKEVLHIRWANLDRNPDAQAQDKRKFEEMAMETVKSMLNNNTTKRIKISNEPNKNENSKISSPSEVVEVEELDDLDEDDEDESDDEGEEEEEDVMVEGVQTTNNEQSHKNHLNHNDITINTNKKRSLSKNNYNNYKFGSSGNFNDNRSTIVNNNNNESDTNIDSRDIRNGYFNGNGIINDSTFKNIARLKKKLKFQRHEPCLVSVLCNYSSDEDDD
ncbi:CWC2 [Candida jiufengensis]|uniref:CWC2 n=1 Tax=Candida jiufengensis TaxID=497108 RepID=UPI0022259E54|nr:CWC2 [Candida jiufengensis]KAI5951600.1 CWC2 [Candida jiufengensis]